MTSSLEKRLNECDKKIDALFKGVKLNEEIEKQLKSIQAYYHKLYIESIDKQAEKECIKIYELLVTGLEGIKKGDLKSEEVLKELDEITSIRKSNILLENILTALELLCWAALSGVFFSYCVLMAPPLVAVNPFFALAILSIACMAAIYSTVNFFNCIDEFKSSTPVEEEFKREKNLISFFKFTPPSESPSKVFEPNEYPQKEQLYPVII
ncbi:DUF5638 domain-containing protein [Fluoribacter gormanii]|uniref:DUF5638 domain-containing protein n=1 Tax=Fluoribacter gormanii TaxID=464 RepID=A0A377GIN8_9GAMM|nr:DUF5638 domain-containing protein [Fluoribacter gormanii]KTD00264.1 hypothetical protein Lgor_3159 [Fluoribacter gormanii]MCW8443803.1 DUF5638 domain-containing protein [Fluoribacter gormanii]MCW8472231.1 DUF5638 domain-containing protein [Fluoribacter gormanii]SIQ89045.1 hypothetical protein SAMN05421777_10438 [Fluoribacter gormanii]STO24641.1 Uncharacterised protein [Fluoribacter gormanii]